MYPPGLRADDPANRGVLSSPPVAGTRVRIGQLGTLGPFQLDTLELGKPAGKPDPAGMRYELWLEGTNEGWQLQVADVPKEPGAQASSVIGRVPLARKTAAVPSPSLVAALVPEAESLARLSLRWGTYEATTDVQIPFLPIPASATNSPPNTTTNRTHDEDLSPFFRFLTLTQRSETALVLPSGKRLSVAFQRTFAKGDRAINAAGQQTSRGLPTDGPDFARVASTPVGSVVQLASASVPRLKIDVPFRFGTTTIATSNQGPGLPGLYGIWLKRVAGGWRLVFNHEADVWGSQYDPKQDAAEIDLAHTENHAATRPFAVALVPTADDRGRLVVLWGAHEWTADFTIER